MQKNMNTSSARRSKAANQFKTEVESDAMCEAAITPKQHEGTPNQCRSGKGRLSKTRGPLDSAQNCQKGQGMSPAVKRMVARSSVTPTKVLSAHQSSQNQRSQTRASASLASQMITKSNHTSNGLSSKRNTRSSAQSAIASQTQARETTRFQQQERSSIANSAVLPISKQSKKIQKSSCKVQAAKRSKGGLKTKTFLQNDQENAQTAQEAFKMDAKTLTIASMPNANLSSSGFQDSDKLLLRDITGPCISSSNQIQSPNNQILVSQAGDTQNVAITRTFLGDQQEHNPKIDSSLHGKSSQAKHGPKRGRGRPKKAARKPIVDKATNHKSQRSLKSELESILPANEDLKPIKQNQMNTRKVCDGSSNNNTIKKIMKGQYSKLVSSFDIVLDSHKRQQDIALTSNTKMTNNETSQNLTKYGDRQENMGIYNSCLRIGQIDTEDKKNLKLDDEGRDERRITEFQYSETSVMNNVDEEKENISESEMIMAEEAEDKGACLPFQVAAHQVDNKQHPAVEIEDLDQSMKFETRLSQAKLAIPLNQGKENHLDKNKNQGRKQFVIDEECEQEDNRIGNEHNISIMSPKEAKQNAFDLSANCKKQNPNQFQYQQFINDSPMPMENRKSLNTLNNGSSISILGSSQMNKQILSIEQRNSANHMKQFHSLLKMQRTPQANDHKFQINTFDRTNLDRSMDLAQHDQEELVEDNEQEQEQSEKAERLAHQAREQKNSKYDEADYLVDFSDQQNKMRKIGYNEFAKSGQSAAGKPLLDSEQQQEPEMNLTSASGKKSQPKRSKKRMAKENVARENVQWQNQYKSNELLNKMNEEHVQIQIKQIKIDNLTMTQQVSSSLNVIGKTQSNPSKLILNKSPSLLTNIQSKSNHVNQEQRLENPNNFDEDQLQAIQDGLLAQQSNHGLNMGHQQTSAAIHYQNNMVKNLNDIPFGETQQNLIRHQMQNPHLYKRGPTKYQKSNNNGLNGNVKAKGHWTEAEDKKLAEAVKLNKGKNWKKIAETIEGRTDVQCLHRWQKVLNPNLVKGPWTDIEDRLLLQLVNVDGPQKWTQVANHLPGRIGKQCRERWHNHLNPMIKRSSQWTREEEWILFLLNRDQANKWADIANVLEGRTDNTIKNHWNSSMKKRIKDYIEEFEMIFRQVIDQSNIQFQGCQPVELDDNGNAKKNPKGYSKEYIKIMKDLEVQLLEEKSLIVKEQNREYYYDKCMHLIDQAKNDSFCRAAANIMLNSGSEYLQELKEKCGHLVAGSDLDLYNEPMINVNEEQVVEMIDKFKNRQAENMNDEQSEIDQYMKDNTQFEITPSQCQKMNMYGQHDHQMNGSSQCQYKHSMGALEASGISVVAYDKENSSQINRPVKKKGMPSKRAGGEDMTISDIDNQACIQFDSMMNADEAAKDKQGQAFQPIMLTNSDYNAQKRNTLKSMERGLATSGNAKKFASQFENSAMMNKSNFISPMGGFLTFHQHLVKQSYQQQQLAVQQKAQQKEASKVEGQPIQQKQNQQEDLQLNGKQNSLISPLKQLGANVNGQAQQKALLESSSLNFINAVKAMTKSPLDKFSAERFMGSSNSTKNATSNNDKAAANISVGDDKQWPISADNDQKHSHEKSHQKSTVQQCNHSGNLVNVAQLLSAKSSKIGASIFNQSAVSAKQIENSVQSRKHVNGDKTPNMKAGHGGLNINAFSVAGIAGANNSNGTGGAANSNVKSNIKMPIAQMSMKRQNLFSAASEVKAFRSSESLKSSYGPKQTGGELTSFFQFGTQSPPQKHDENQEESQQNQNSMKNPQSMEQLCANLSTQQMTMAHHDQAAQFKHPNQRIPPNAMQPAQNLTNAAEGQNSTVSHAHQEPAQTFLPHQAAGYAPHPFYFYPIMDHVTKQGQNADKNSQGCGGGCNCQHQSNGTSGEAPAKPATGSHSQQFCQMACYYPHIPPFAFNPQAFIVESINGGSQFLLTAKNPPPGCTNYTAEDADRTAQQNEKSNSLEKSSQDGQKKALDPSKNSQEKSSDSDTKHASSNIFELQRRSSSSSSAFQPCKSSNKPIKDTDRPLDKSNKETEEQDKCLTESHEQIDNKQI